MKRTSTVYVDGTLIQKAKDAGLNISQELTAALEAKLNPKPIDPYLQWDADVKDQERRTIEDRERLIIAKARLERLISYRNTPRAAPSDEDAIAKLEKEIFNAENNGNNSA